MAEYKQFTVMIAWHKLKGKEQVGKFARLLQQSPCDAEWEPVIIKDKELDKKFRERREMDKLKDIQSIFNNVFKTCPITAPSLVTTDIVSVQPMAGPLDPKYAIPLFVVSSKTRQQESEEQYNIMLESIKPGETLKRYCYGGLVSLRGGYYVERNNRVLRYNLIIIS